MKGIILSRWNIKNPMHLYDISRILLFKIFLKKGLVLHLNMECFESQGSFMCV